MVLPLISGRNWSWSESGVAGGRWIGTGVGPESVGEVSETFSSFEVGCAATSAEGEGSCGEETASEERDALWEPALL